MAILTLVDFANAKRDISDVGKSVNEDTIVQPRWGGAYDSLPRISRLWLERFDLLATNAESMIQDWQDAINLITVEGGIPALAVSDASGISQQEFNNKTITTVETIADLLAIQNPKDGQVVFLIMTGEQYKYNGSEWVAVNKKESKSIYDFLEIPEDYTSIYFDWSPAFDRATRYFKNTGGKINVPVKAGGYLLNGIVQADGQLVGIQTYHTGGSDHGATSVSTDIIGESSEVKFLCGSDNMIVIRHSNSYSEIGKFKVQHNGKIGCTALSLTPESWVAAKRFSQQSHNFIHDISTHGMRQTLEFACGGDGGAYYNLLQNIYHVGREGYGGRGFGLLSWKGSEDEFPSVKSTVNRNVFINCKAFFCNQGFYIEAGDTNRFYGCSVEGAVQAGEFEETPTALRILEKDPLTGSENQLNKLYGFEVEACIRDAVILNQNIKIYGHNLDARKVILNPMAAINSEIVGSADLSVFPNIQSGTVTGTYLFPSNWDDEMSVVGSTNYINIRNFDKGFNEKSYELTASEISGVSSIVAQSFYFKKTEGNVNLVIRLAFNALSESSAIRIPLPVNANSAKYAGSGSLIDNAGLFTFPIYISNGRPELTLGAARFDLSSDMVTHLLVYPHPDGWDTLGGYNKVHLELSYSS